MSGRLTALDARRWLDAAKLTPAELERLAGMILSQLAREYRVKLVQRTGKADAEAIER